MGNSKKDTPYDNAESIAVNTNFFVLDMVLFSSMIIDIKNAPL